MARTRSTSPARARRRATNGANGHATTSGAPATKHVATAAAPWFERLRVFASAWWYPWVIGALSACNTFLIVLSGPLTGLFCAGVLAGAAKGRSKGTKGGSKRGDTRFASSKWGRLPLCAFANALGSTVGIAALMWVVTRPGGAGMAYARAKWPDLFGDGGGGGALDAEGAGGWARTRGLVRDYGVAGAVLVSAMPVVLHPLALFGVAAGMAPATLCACVLVGRTVKYAAVGGLALAAPGVLRLKFGGAATKAGQEELGHND